ncbi:hypothetical protein BC829DRAFT_401836 [Chytridium lagenaria]|nr:hypothetical protein BC829DRAFT_401836 [Chytridium lagenaria]
MKSLKERLSSVTAHKAIAMEIGTDIPIAEGWRGRSQKIAMLKSLSAALAAVKSETRRMSTLEVKVVPEAIVNLWFYIILTSQMSQDLMKDLRVKYDSSSSRNKYLESELREMKSKIGLLVDKSEKDDI